MKKNFHTSVYIFLDFLAAIFAWIVFYSVRKEILGEDPQRVSGELIINSLLVASFWILYYACSGFYHNIYKKSRVREFLSLLTSTFLGVIFIFFLLLLDDEGIEKYTEYYKTFGTYFLLQFLLTAFPRIVFVSYIKDLILRGELNFRTLIIGSSKNAKEIVEELSKNYSLGFSVAGYVHISEEELGHSDLKNEFKIRHFGNYRNLTKLVRRGKIKQVIIALEPSEHAKAKDILERLYGTGVSISIIPDIYQVLLGAVKVNHLFGTPLLEINQDLIPVWQKVAKRGIDIAVSLAVLVLGLPFFLTVGLITKLSSKGPVFYSQERVGMDGKIFRIIKYRSMYVNAESNGPALSSEDDPRITPWGRFMRRTRIDEFPQFYNVLIGDMSLVGPRPERTFYIEQITKHAPYYIHLHRVRPGITSLGQVKFGYAENVDQMIKRLKYDILYIENMSLAMDFRIILYTIIIMIQGRGK